MKSFLTVFVYLVRIGGG